MGGYAGYVWPAYGLTTLVLALNWWSALRREAEELTDARRRMATEKENRA